MSSATSGLTSSRQRIIQVLLVVIAFLGSMAIYRCLTASPKYHPQFHTIAHRFLDVESKYAYIPDDSYELLDDIITEIKASAHYDPTIKDPAAQQKQLLHIFSTIDSILIQRNFIFPGGEWTSTLGEALEGNRLSAKEKDAALSNSHNARRVGQMKDHADEDFHLMACEPAAFLYMGVAEAMGFQLKAVHVPEHIFVRAVIDQNHSINWDANRGRSIPDAEYIRLWQVKDRDIRENVYMHSLTDDETTAEMYTNIGVRVASHPGFRGQDAEMECYRKAVELNPNDIYANDRLVSHLLFAPTIDAATRAEARKSAERVLALLPDDGLAHSTMAYVDASDGQTPDAVRELNKAIQLDSDSTEEVTLLPYIEAGGTMYSGLRAQSPISFWIYYERGKYYILAAVVIGLMAGLVCWIRSKIIRRNASAPSPTTVLPTSNLQQAA